MEAGSTIRVNVVSPAFQTTDFTLPSSRVMYLARISQG